ncbi:hypothetical protein [Phyllobacterium pellucidum]|uniref:hypothetical protein n=1 Tax=Phyllobacterium pellucidum TaxID=2740464 RepID=UPI001D14D6E4|nr:hypothetical protein [Phyllobacterium sp. T1018]UGY10183.1 hypothetical protein LLE51_003095 [Phyllobacterium sp. T1018]
MTNQNTAGLSFVGVVPELLRAPTNALGQELDVASLIPPLKTQPKINREQFFNSIKKELFRGSLSPRQHAGLNNLLDYWDANFQNGDDRWLAYILATAFHETGRAMQPIKEKGTNEYFRERYDKRGSRPWKAKELGNNVEGDGVLFAGRGFVQLTGRRNFRDWTFRLNRHGIDLEGNPDLALDPIIATEILFQGMYKGTFTKYRLENFINSVGTDWRQARRIINKLDRADDVAGYAIKFHTAITKARVSNKPPVGSDKPRDEYRLP